MSVNRFSLRPTGVAALMFVAALVVTGCAGSSRTPKTVVVALRPAPTTASDSSGGPVAAVTAAPANITNLLVTAADPDGKWKVTFKKPLVAGLADAVQSKINDAINVQVNGYVSAFTARGDFPAVAKGASPSHLEGDYAIALNSPTIISLRFSQLVSISGQEHPTGTPGSINFQVSSGKSLALADLFTDPKAAVSTIAMKTHSALVTTAGTELTWDGKASSLDFFSKAWAVTADGLEFTWPQGQIASAAAGMPSATVAWADLKPLLKQGNPLSSLVK